MIADLLPRYYEARGRNPEFTVIESHVVEGHEVAWVEYVGAVDFDLTGEGHEGEPFKGRTVYCECDFTENVGWQQRQGYAVDMMGTEKCPKRQAVLRERRLQLRQEYNQRFGSMKEHAREIILDLIERSKAGQSVGEDTTGASS